MRVRDLVVLGVLVVASSGCREPASSSQRSTRSSAKAAESTGPTVQYPVVLTGNAVPTDVLDGAQAARTISQKLDEKCALLVMDPALTPSRPFGIGCPRRPSNVKGAK